MGRVDQDRPQVVGERGRRFADGPAQHFLDTGDDLADVDNPRTGHLAEEGEQLAGDVRRPFVGLGDVVEVAAGPVPASNSPKIL